MTDAELARIGRMAARITIRAVADEIRTMADEIRHTPDHGVPLDVALYRLANYLDRKATRSL